MRTRVQIILPFMNHLITIYEKPTCSTCRQVKKAFDARGIAFDTIIYIIDPPSKADLERIVAGLDVPAQELVRTKEDEFKKLGLDISMMSPTEIVNLLSQHPALMQRPIIEIKGKYILGRPVDKIEHFLDEMAKG